jgi:hypothetical protein
VAQAIEHLPSKYKTLISKPRTTKKKKKRLSRRHKGTMYVTAWFLSTLCMDVVPVAWPWPVGVFTNRVKAEQWSHSFICRHLGNVYFMTGREKHSARDTPMSDCSLFIF